MRKLIIITVLVLILYFIVLFTASAQLTSDYTSFNVGEVSPLLYGRVDFAKYNNSCKILQNMLVTSQGPVVRRPGLKYIAEVKDSNDAVRLIPFEYSIADTYILEFGPSYMRVFRNGGQVLNDDNSVYEAATNYDDDELDDLRYVQSADVMYLVDGNDRPYTLSRTDHNDWTFTAFDYNDGPFQDENTTTATITASATAAGADVNLVSSTPLFAAGDVNSVWQLTHRKAASTLSGTFTSATSSSTIACSSKYTAVTHGTWKGIIYLQRSTDAGSTWNLVEPRSSQNDDNLLRRDEETESGTLYRFNMSSYTSGSCKYDFTVEDYLHSGSVRITDYNDPCNVTGKITSELASTQATKLWNLPYWSGVEGWPRTIRFHEERLYYGGNDNWPQTIWASKVSDYPNMKIGTLDDDALIFLLPGQNPIRWMSSQDYLLIGSSGGTGVLQSGSSTEPITATSVQYKAQSNFGSANIDSILAGETILYVERDLRKVRAFVYDFVRDSYASPDMTILSAHITDSGIKEMAYQSHPDNIVWCIRNDGDVATFVHEADNEVTGWSRIVTDGDFESVAVVPGSEEDEVWFVVKRSVNSVTRRYIEQLQPFDWGSSQVDCFYVDSALTWDGGNSVVISAVTKANPGVVTVVTWPTDEDGNLGDGDQIKILAVVGMTQLNGTVYTIHDPNVGAKTFALRNSADTANVDTTSYTTYSSGGTVQRFEKDFTNLAHLRGKTCSVLSDGGVLADVVISSTGTFTISQWANKIHIGLPYTSVLETLPLYLKTQFGTLALNQKRLAEVGIDFYNTAGAKYGTSAANVQEINFREVSADPNNPVPLFSGKKRLNVQAGWNDDITVYVNQEYALPLTVRSITTKVDVGR